MEVTTISSKYQVVIPQKIRRRFNLKPGQKIAFIPYKNTLRVVIIPPIEEGYGFLEGMDTDIPRDLEKADR